MYLSVIDLFVLVICASDLVLTYGFSVEFRLVSDFTCKIHTFLTYFLTHMSSVVLMCVSIERLLVVLNINLTKKFKINFLNKYRIEKVLGLISCLIFLLILIFLLAARFDRFNKMIILSRI